jgi:hypothetical protein
MNSKASSALTLFTIAGIVLGTSALFIDRNTSDVRYPDRDPEVGKVFQLKELAWACSTWDEHNKLVQAGRYGSPWDFTRAVSEAKECLRLDKGEEVRVHHMDWAQNLDTSETYRTACVQKVKAAYPYCVIVKFETLEAVQVAEKKEGETK